MTVDGVFPQWGKVQETSWKGLLMRTDVLDTVAAGLAGDVAGTFNHPRDDRSPVVRAILAGGVGGELGITAPAGLPGSKAAKFTPATRYSHYIDTTRDRFLDRD